MRIGRLLGVTRNPARLVVVAFVVLISFGTVLLRLPIAVDADAATLGWKDALFWSTSASTVTGLGTVDVADFSLFGELVLLALIQIGGFGIMTIGTVFALVLARHVGLRQRMLAQVEIGAVDLGELRHLVVSIAKITVVTEAAIAAVLAVPFLASDDLDTGPAIYHAAFHGVSAFNNAGISLYSDSLADYATNPFVVFPITAAFIAGGLGFPIFVEFWRRTPRRRWSLHTRVMLAATAVLLLVGPAVVLVFEWRNPATLGPLGTWDKLQTAWFQGVTPRTAGFSTIDIGSMREPTLVLISGLMFIGAGPASTSGGIKVTTFAVLAFVMWAQVRGDADVNVFRRRLPTGVIRQAVTVALMAVGVVFGTAVAITAWSSFGLTSALFEATSAFGTVGLSTGITGALPTGAQLLLVIVMLAGRVGPVTFATAIALRHRSRAYRLAEEAPIIG